MRIGILLPSVLGSNHFLNGRIFAPLVPAVALADQLVGMGHEVFFYGSQDIKTKAKIITGDPNLSDKDLLYYQFRYRDPLQQKYTTLEIVKRDFEYDLTLKAYQDAKNGKLDIIHSYHDFGAHYFNELTKFPTIYTLHDPLPRQDNTVEYMRFSKFQHHNYISISDSQRKSILNLNFIDTVYHGLDLNQYEFNEKGGDYMIYFGRLIEDKGPDIAIELARKINMSIRVASSTSKANMGEGYCKEKILPFIDEKSVVMSGYLQGKEKSDYIGNAKVYVLPLRWDEPFGLTIIESLACGTPVVGFARGSLPELVKDGVTGFVVDPKEGIEGLEKAVKKIDTIDRKACRKSVEENFTIQKMAKNYEEVYRKVLSQ